MTTFNVFGGITTGQGVDPTSREYIENTFESTYRDDFTDSDGFHRILFNSGRALQARELTQLQTIMQTEMGRFGKNIFKEGAPVNPGNATVGVYEFVKLNTTQNTLPSPASDLKGGIAVGANSSIQARVIEVLEAEGDDPATLYVQYTATSGFVNPDTTISPRFQPGEVLTVTTESGTPTLTVQTTNTTDNPATGQGTVVSSAPGDFFVEGHFVFAPAQSIVLSKYEIAPTATIGFLVIQDIVTALDDDSLYDNQGSVPNITAPGADRYRIQLQLDSQANVDSDANFVFYCNIRDGEIIQQTTGNDQYNKIADLLALRTREESGNYIVDRFDCSIDDIEDDASKLAVTVSSGTAYVNGYRAHIPASQKIEINKPTSTTSLANQFAAANIGNYVKFVDQDGLPDISTFEELTLWQDSAATGTVLGKARVRSIEPDGANYRAHLFDIRLQPTKNFRNVTSIGTGATAYISPVKENGLTILKETQNNNLLFELPRTRPQSISDIDLTVQRRFAASNSGGATTINLTAPGEAFADTTSWICTNEAGDIYSASITASAQSATITGGPTTGGVVIYAYVAKGFGAPRVKTLVEDTVTSAIQTDSNGQDYINLGKADIFDVVRISSTDSNGQDLANTFTVDNGQRDNFYGIGRLNVKSGTTAPSGDVFVRYQYFTHGGSGDFFCVNSYSGQIDYKDIPAIRTDGGVNIDLKNVLDFRPVMDSAGGFSDVATGARINELPRNTGLVQADVTYYNRRNDKVIITEQGGVEILSGEESLEPQYPEVPTNALEIYKLEFNANTLDRFDLTSKMVEAKHFTMADIGRIETKLYELQETVSLSLLEADVSALLVFDSDGLPRTKSGFFVDNFKNQVMSGVWYDDYRASIDPREGTLHPAHYANNTRLIYDEAASTGVIKKGDNIYLDHDTQLEISQWEASGTENVNPFAVVSNRGHIFLSPSSDDWMDNRQTADKVVDGGIEINSSQALLWNSWEWNWDGTDTNNIQVGNVVASDNSSSQSEATSWWGVTTRTTTNSTTVDRISAIETVREVIGNRIIDVAIIPWARSRKIFFRAEGLRPDTQYFAFFDDTPVESWVREEPFQRVSDVEEDYGIKYRGAVQHPEGFTDLYSDAQGKIEGSFFLPNGGDPKTLRQRDSFTATEGSKTGFGPVRFRTGVRKLTLLDISVYSPARALSQAHTYYWCFGAIATWQRTIQSTRHVTITGTTSTTTEVDQWTVQRVDPLAQSFFVEDPSGIFVSSVQLYFRTKDDTVPVQVQIRPMVNGQPSSEEIVPGAVKFMSPADVNIPVRLDDLAEVRDAPTTFFFDEPVYLSPQTEYSVVVLADGTGYNTYVAETEQFVLGSTESRINRQASTGSLFKSQNGSTWEPSQKQDLMFRLYRCNFTANSGTIVFHNTDLPDELLEQDPFTTSSDSDSLVYLSHPNHGFDVGDNVVINGLDSAEDYNGIKGSTLLGTQTIVKADGTGYTFAPDSDATQSGQVGGGAVTVSQNENFILARPTVQAMIPRGTATTMQGKFTTGKSYAGGEVRYSKDIDWTNIRNRENNTFDQVRMIGNAQNEELNLGAGIKSADIRMNISTSNASVTPVIDCQRASLTVVNYAIDNQDSDASSGFNVPINFVSETVPVGGSSLSKHITRPTTLEQDAVGLKILVGANRPEGTSFDMYYRVSDDGTGLDNKDWILVEPDSLLAADDQPWVFKQYEYLLGGDGGSLAPFVQFQLKIVMNSTNTAKVPRIRDLRAIALAV